MANLILMTLPPPLITLPLLLRLGGVNGVNNRSSFKGGWAAVVQP